MAFVLLFLTVSGGLSDVGTFSAATAVTAPIAMFLVFRYVEWISLATDPVKAFSESTSVAITGFILACPFIYWGLAGWIRDHLFIKLLLIYKPFEIISDLIVTLHAARNKRLIALISAYVRLFGVIALSILFVYGLKIKPLHGVVVALLTSYVTTFLLYDMPILRRFGLFILPNASESVNYIRFNFSYGLLNLAVTLNSSMPRYFLAFQQDLKSLGLYSLLYQVAATGVNIIQYPLSIKVKAVYRLIRENIYKIRVSLVLGAMLTLSACVGSALGWIPSLQPNVGGWGRILYIVLIGFMFLPLLLRGALITSAIGAARGEKLYSILATSMVISIFIVGASYRFGTAEGGLVLACAYVSASSIVTSWYLLPRLAGA